MTCAPSEDSGCPGWTESSLGTQVRLLVLSCCGSFCTCIELHVNYISSATIQNAVSAFSQLFRRNKKLNFFFESGSFVLKSWTGIQNMTRNDTHECIQCFMQWLFSNLMKFQCSSGFLSAFYRVSALIRFFVFIVFFSCWWPVIAGILTK